MAVVVARHGVLPHVILWQKSMSGHPPMMSHSLLVLSLTSSLLVTSHLILIFVYDDYRFWDDQVDKLPLTTLI
jgi:hypothetical protein